MVDDTVTHFRVIEGGGEIVGFLERLLDMARDGKIDMIATAVCESDGMIGSGLAYRETDYPFSRMLGAVRVLEHDILTGRLSFEQ